MPHSPQASSPDNPALVGNETRPGFGFMTIKDPLTYAAATQHKPFRACMDRSVIRPVANWPQGFEGRGVERYESGEVYIGEYMGGERGGRGVFRHTNGQTLITAWRHNAPTGEGVQWAGDGKKAAHMKDGRPVKAITLEEAGAISHRLGVALPPEWVPSLPPPPAAPTEEAGS